jgi:hypothetical protein
MRLEGVPDFTLDSLHPCGVLQSFQRFPVVCDHRLLSLQPCGLREPFAERVSAPVSQVCYCRLKGFRTVMAVSHLAEGRCE